MEAAPTIADVVVDEEESHDASVRRESETELVATESEGQIRRLLDGTIEEWMVYLHPSQRAIVRADFNGPSRVSRRAGNRQDGGRTAPREAACARGT